MFLRIQLNVNMVMLYIIIIVLCHCNVAILFSGLMHGVKKKAYMDVRTNQKCTVIV